MKRFSLFVLFWGLSLVILAQNVQVLWSHVYGTSLNEEPNHLTMNANGDIGITGYRASYNFFLLKTTHQGNEVWTVYLDSLRGYGICSAPDGGFVCATTVYKISQYIDTVAGSNDVWIAKFDSAGNFEWGRSFMGNLFDESWDCISDGNGYYYITGETYSIDFPAENLHPLYNNPDYGMSDDVFVIKMDDAGNVIWSKAYGGSSYEGGHSIFYTGNKLFVTGETFESGDGDLTYNHCYHNCEENFWMFSLDTAGTLEWQRCLGACNTDAAYGGVITTGGDFVAAGMSMSSPFFDIPAHYGGEDILICGMDSTFGLKWVKVFGGAGNDKAKFVKRLIDGGTLVGGYCELSQATGRDGYLMHLDKNGDTIMTVMLGGTGADELRDCIVEDDGYIILGSTTSSDGDVGENAGGKDVWLFKVTSDIFIPHQYVDTVACLGSDFEFEAGYRSLLPVRTELYKDGNLLFDGYERNYTLSGITYQDSGNYVFVMYSATDTDSVFFHLGVAPPPSVSVIPPQPACYGSDLVIFSETNGGTPPYSYHWNNGGTSYVTVAFGITSSAYYRVTVTDANGCEATAETYARVISPDTIPIGVVSIDRNDNYPVIYWELPDSNVTDSVLIFRCRYDSSWFYPIAGIPSVYPSYFKDTTADINFRYKYKLLTVDICGTYSSVSSAHAPIRLDSLPSVPSPLDKSFSQGTYIRLGWSNYFDSEYRLFPAFYYVYRQDEYGNMSLAGLFSLYDTTYCDYPEDTGIYEYFVKASCLPVTVKDSSGTLFTVQASYSNVIAKHFDQVEHAFEDITGGEKNIKIFPNPADNSLYVQLPENYVSGVDIAVNDINGVTVYSKHETGKRLIEINLTGLNAGTYTVTVKHDKILLGKLKFVKK